MIFGFRDDDLTDLSNYLQMYYHKILRVNLTTDTYEVILLQNEHELPAHNCLSKWLDDYCALLVHPEDKMMFRRNTNLENMKAHVYNGETQFNYRRFMGGLYEDSRFILMPSYRWEPDNQVCLLFVKEL